MVNPDSPGDRVEEADPGVDVILEEVVVHVKVEEKLVVDSLLLPLALAEFEGEGVSEDVAHGIRRRHHQLHYAGLQMVFQSQPVD